MIEIIQEYLVMTTLMELNPIKPNLKQRELNGTTSMKKTKSKLMSLKVPVNF